MDFSLCSFSVFEGLVVCQGPGLYRKARESGRNKLDRVSAKSNHKILKKEQNTGLFIRPFQGNKKEYDGFF